MSQTSLQPSVHQTPSSHPEPLVAEMVAQVVSFAREARQDVPLEERYEDLSEARYRDLSKDSAQVFPSFNRVLQVSGRYLLTSDLIALIAAFTCGGFIAWAADIYLFKADFQQLFDILSIQQFIVFSGLGAMALLWLDTKGHYRQRLPYWETAGHVVVVVLLGFLGAGFLHFAAKSSSSSRLWMGLSWALFAVFLFGGRAMARRVLDKHGQWKIPAVIVGTGPTAQAALQAIGREHEMGFTIAGHAPASTLENLTKPHAWKNLLMIYNACHIFLALEGSEIEKNPAAMKAMVRARIPCSIIPPWLGLPSSTLSPHYFMMHDVMMLHDTNRLQLPLPRLVKRSFDMLIAGVALILLAPLFAVVTLIVRGDGGPAFFKQKRVGRGGKLFDCYKFRSMHINAEESLKKYLAETPDAALEWKQFQKLKNDVRITKSGHFIRRTSIDELPQLINVFRGEMSLVGPRPCMPGQEGFYAEDFSFYESVRPGITGPWQVSGRNRLTFKERVHLESWYARNWSLWMDIVILLKTVPTLLKKDGAF